ncbi:MAG TPA: hypothetical protein VF120_06430 [Ktedonobacterales bacterium]
MTSTQPTQAPTQIDLPYPTSQDNQLWITVGACRLTVRPGAGDKWVSGTYSDPTGALPYRIAQEDTRTRITQEHLWPVHWGSGHRPPVFDLALGTSRPFALTLESGASEAHLDLGGLPLTRLIARLGAGKFNLDFSMPNPQLMTVLDVSSGAGSMDVHNLANANCPEIVLNGGAAAYTFDFGGTLQRETHVRISTGLSSVSIAIPSQTAATITSESFLGSIEVGDGFTKQGGAYLTPQAIKGSTPLLRIATSVALGAVCLRLM